MQTALAFEYGFFSQIHSGNNISGVLFKNVLIITVFGQNENAVRDYLSENAEHTELSHTRHIATVNGTGYYVVDKALSNSTLAEIKSIAETISAAFFSKTFSVISRPIFRNVMLCSARVSSG